MGRRRALVWVLRIFGGSSLLALPFVFAPEGWMASAHRDLGLGELPRAPIVLYLARSLSAFYAAIGGFALLFSTDIDRNRPAITYLAAVVTAFGMIAFGIDLRSGMPSWWVWGEGSSVTGLGLLLLWLVRGSRENPS